MKYFIFILTTICFIQTSTSQGLDYNMSDPNMGQFITKPGKSKASVYDSIYPWLIKHPSGN